MIQVWTNIDIDGPVDSHSYDIRIEDDVYTISRSNDSNWVDPGEEVASIEDHGNGLLIQIGETEIDLDYSEVEQLMALLLAYNTERIELREFKTIKSI
jgi:hypothetical protein